MKTLPVHVSMRIVQDGISAMGCAQFLKQWFGGMAIGEEGKRAFDKAGDAFLSRYSESHPEMNDDKPMTPEQARAWLLAIAHEIIRILEAA